jgi:hypothetical protein
MRWTNGCLAHSIFVLNLHIIACCLFVLSINFFMLLKVCSATITDIHGTHATTVFGSYIERGESGQIITRKERLLLEGFLQEIDRVDQFVNAIFARVNVTQMQFACTNTLKVCVEVAINVAKVPLQYKLWSAISLLFWNVTSTTASHIDLRDF